jgi:hypothetical protein
MMQRAYVQCLISTLYESNQDNFSEDSSEDGTLLRFAAAFGERRHRRLARRLTGVHQFAPPPLASQISKILGQNRQQVISIFVRCGLRLRWKSGRKGGNGRARERGHERCSADALQAFMGELVEHVEHPILASMKCRRSQRTAHTLHYTVL